MKRIIYTNDDGGVSIIVPTGTIEACIKDVPAGKAYEIVDAAAIPTDRTFRNAWKEDLTVDMPKAKLIAHDKRRAKRTAEFAPLDVQATIPSKAAQAEADRQVIRDKYDAMQVSIDSATDVATLKSIVETL
tara:strand:+ start:314 stop:706 length:393 start_codon:yes stop_codon:yes gene_type:complete